MDSSLLTEDGTMYVGTTAGALVQVDHRGPGVNATYLGKPYVAPRMKGFDRGSRRTDLRGQRGRLRYAFLHV